MIGRRPQLPAPPSLAAQMVRRRGVVTEVDGSGWDGVVLHSDPSGLVMASASDRKLQRLDRDGEGFVVDGSVFVPASRVQFVQFPDGWPG